MPTEPPDHGSMLGPFSMKLPLDAEIDLDDVEYRAIVDRIIGQTSLAARCRLQLLDLTQPWPGPAGHEARDLAEDHRRNCHLGEHSPLGKLYQMGAYVLLLGVGYERCTAFHLAEYRYTESPPMTIIRGCHTGRPE